MLHGAEMMAELDKRVAFAIDMQVRDEANPDFGGFLRPGMNIVEPRESGFFLADLITAYICSESAYHGSEEAAEAIRRDLVYMARHQRPDGCFDLSGCNFASPPDTAFMTNHMLSAWWLLEKRGTEANAWIREPLLKLIVTCAEGVAAGGFHTPNHRWAIAACLKSVFNITGRKEFSDRADQYLAEGLDINGDGEFAERSSGGYNMVNDDQMLRLFMATGEKRFLEAARANLLMMFHYIEPDGSVFTNNSTRQDQGQKAWLDGYFILYLLTGYFLKEPAFARIAEYVYRESRKRGIIPGGIHWLLLYEDLDGYGAGEDFDETPIRRYSRLFPDSRIARVRNEDYSWTIMENRPNFLYFQHGGLTLYLLIYSNLCDRRHFLGEKIVPAENGYAMESTANSWYYKPFYPDLPDTSDWWAMDNPNRRERYQGVPLKTKLKVTDTGDGIDVELETEGIDRLPFRLEAAVLPCRVQSEQFIMEGKAGEKMTLRNGNLTFTGDKGGIITLGPGFCEHNALLRSTEAYPMSRDHFIVCMTDFTPVKRKLHIGTKPLEKRELRTDTMSR